MDVVVGYRRPAATAHNVIGAVLLGSAALVFVLTFVAILFTIPMVVTGMDSSMVDRIGITGGVVMAVLIAGGILCLTGILQGPIRKISAPYGIAWVLQPGGALVRTDRGEARIPWAAARFDRVPVAGLPGVRLSGPGVEVAYPEVGLSHNLGQIMFLAGRYANERPTR